MEDGIANAGGFECTETVAEVFNETVTTEKPAEEAPSAKANLAYSQTITADTLIVTFDGVEYTCPKQNPVEWVSVYGDENFSQIPFRIVSSSSGNTLYTENAGEHTIKAEIIEYSATITPCFKNAVLLAAETLIPEEYYTRFSISGSDDDGYTTSISQSEIYNIAMRGSSQLLALNPRGVECHYAGFYQAVASFVGLYYHPSDAQLKAEVYKIPASGAITHESIVLSNNN